MEKTELEKLEKEVLENLRKPKQNGANLYWYELKENNKILHLNSQGAKTAQRFFVAIHEKSMEKITDKRELEKARKELENIKAHNLTYTSYNREPSLYNSLMAYTKANPEFELDENRQNQN